MLSSVYQMSSNADAKAMEVDPDNRLLSHFSRRRLLAEEMRDAMLQISQTIDTAVGGEFPFPAVETWNFQSGQEFDASYPTNKRSVYQMVSRFRPRPFFALFDAADPNSTTELRTESITPKQALYLMNDPFVHEQSKALAQRIVSEMPKGDQTTLIQSLWRVTIGRPANFDEISEAQAFLDAYHQRQQSADSSSLASDNALAAYARALMTSNEFLYVD
jgi:hypothetical protein